MVAAQRSRRPVRRRLEPDVRLALQDHVAEPGVDTVRPLDGENFGRALHRSEPDGVTRSGHINRAGDIGHAGQPNASPGERNDREAAAVGQA